MKMIHLADLHIGKVVNGFSMLEDQQHVLSQILKYIKEHKVQAVLISGDVYDKPTPGVNAVKVFDQFLTDLTKENTAIFIISGNHDSPERLSFAGRIMQEQNIYLCGSFFEAITCVTLEDEFGPVNFHLLPFLKPASVKHLFEDQTISSYEDAVKAVLEISDIHMENRNVLLTHQFYIGSGANPELSESEVGPVGGIDSIHVNCVSEFDYVAMGHLHCPQQVGSPHIRYAGSPLKYSFSECHHHKSAALIELGKKGDLSITLLPLSPIHDMRKIKGPISELLSDAVVSQSNHEDYLHITLTDEEEIIDAIGKIRMVYPNVMTLTFENKRTRAGIDLHSIEPLKKASSMELFKSFFHAQNGIEMNSEQTAITKEFFEKTGGES